MQAPDDALDKLRALLLARERQELDELREHVLAAPQRAQDIAEILPQALEASHRARGPQLAKALQTPIADALQATVRANPEPVADALFPVIGPAIRKSITHTLESFTQNLNQQLEHSLSPKGLRWRLEAKRSGVSFGEIVLKHTLRYRVEEVFLIHRAGGLLIAHAVQPDRAAHDKEAISGMLTAIQDFVRESFGKGSADLNQVEIGEHKLWIVRGPHATLAALVRGLGPRELEHQLQQTLEQAHRDFGAALAAFSGDPAALSGIGSLLEACLVSEALAAAPAADLAPPKKNGGLGRMVAAAFALLLGVGLYYWVHDWIIERRVERYAETLRGTPGLVLTDVNQVAGRWRLRGLRDPLAADPERQLAAAGLDSRQVHFELRPYLSLEPVLIVARARQHYGVPGSVGLRLENGVLIFSGEAGADWLRTFRRGGLRPAGVAHLDLRELRASEPAP